MSDQKKVVKVGSRKSELALIQTNEIVRRLKENHPEKEFEIVTMSTLGDQILDKPLPKIGEKSLFTKELEIALERSDVDFVVHSLKDLPTTLPEGMAIGAICKREDPRDAVIFSPKFLGKSLRTLPENSIIGTSSLRRTAQLCRHYSHLKVEDIRGNLNTRLRKLDADDSKYAAIVLALAGITRMGWDSRVGQVLDSEDMLYAVGQGALAIECREGDRATLELLEPLGCRATMARVVAERSLLRALGGGCSAPVAVDSGLRARTLALSAAVWSLDGKQELKGSTECRLRAEFVEDGDYEPPRKCPYREPRLYVGLSPGLLSHQDLQAAEKLGADLAEELIQDGALGIMSAAKKIVTANS